MTKLLLVDDNEQNLYMLQVLLEGHGYEVVLARDGAGALEAARPDPPDLIVTDILMPVMDGFALCREWKTDDRLKAIPFVFYTATYTDPQDEEFALRLGAERFIVKPTEPDVLLGILQEVIKEHEASQLAALQEPVAGEKVYLREYNEALIRRLEGKMVELEETNRALRQEITGRKRAVEVLRESEEKLRAQYKAIPVPTYTWQRDGNDFVLTDFNDAAKGMTQGKIAELVGTRASQLYQDEPQVLDDISRCFAERATIERDMDYRLKTTGERKYLAVKYAFVPPDLIMVHTEDMTERKEAEEQLRRERDFNKTLIQASPAFFVAIDADGKTILMNEAMLCALGYSGDEVIGSDYLTTFVPEEDQEMLSEVFEGLMSSGKPSVNENRVLTRDGRERLVEWHGRSIFEKNGNADYFFGLGIDITERKQAEEALRKANRAYKVLSE